MHASNCDRNECIVGQAKRQETNTIAKAKMPQHYECTFTCAFCSKRKHYGNKCYHKQRLSNKLRSEAQNGGGSAGCKSNGEKGKGESQGRGKGQGQAQRNVRGRVGPVKKDQDKNKDNNQDRSGGNLNPTPGGTNPEPSVGGQNTEPMTRSQTQAQQEQGTKCADEDGEESDVRKRSGFMRMARKLRKKGFHVTCPVEL